jgi:ABC-type transport system involved in multi-copper enzyme maturation permease subunit
VTFLPIVERELRVAARKRSTFWVRTTAAIVALVIGGGFLLVGLFGPGRGSGSLGRGLFGVLTWLSFAAALSAGLFLTSDSLSEEKRGGTLGFLFLTDLRGYDIVLGKVLATSLRSFYAFLATFPVLALTLLMGGLAGAEFWRTVLALVNALLVSVSVGLLISAISRESQKALVGTMLLLVLLVAGGPASDGITAAVQRRAFEPVFSLTSPGWLLVAAGGWGRTGFWAGLLVNQAACWGMLVLASLVLPRTWQERPARLRVQRASWGYAWRFGSARRREARRRRLLEPNPVLWLVCREQWQGILLWTVVLLLAGGLAVSLLAGEDWMLWLAWGQLAGVFTLGLYLLAASQAVRFFVEARQSGLMELILSTPLTSRQVVEGQWRGLTRSFGAPLALWLVAQSLGAFLVQQATWKNMTTTVSAAGGGQAAATAINMIGNPSAWSAVGLALAGTLTIATNLVAISWFGMWTALTARSANRATLRTLVFVQVIPWFGFVFVSALAVPFLLMPRIIGTLGPGSSVQWYALVMGGVATALYLVKNLGFTVWSRSRLHSEFRARASGESSSTSRGRPAGPPVLSPPPLAPGPGGP